MTGPCQSLCRPALNVLIKSFGQSDGKGQGLRVVVRKTKTRSRKDRTSFYVVWEENGIPSAPYQLAESSATLAQLLRASANRAGLLVII
jgi:hypothetical protein